MAKQHFSVSLAKEAADWVERGRKLTGNSFSKEVESLIMAAKKHHPKIRRQEAVDKLREGSRILAEEFELAPDAIMSFAREEANAPIPTAE